MDAAQDISAAFGWPPSDIWKLDMEEFLEWWWRGRDLLQDMQDKRRS